MKEFENNLIKMGIEIGKRRKWKNFGNNVTKAYQKTKTLKKKMSTEAKIIAKSFDTDNKLNLMGKK